MPKATRVPTVKVPKLTQDQRATQNAMTTFRTALAQLKASQAPVDSAAIYAPYRASEQVAGQLGQGLQSSLATAGQNAQDQYTKGLGQAQQQAAQFGISAGAGANPTALQNNGTAQIASQSQAQQAAAPQAAAAWQQLLERTAAAKVSDAQLQRSNLLSQGEATLSSNLPSLIGDEKTKLAQAHAQRFNEGLARTQIDAKQKADLRSYLLGAAKVQTSAKSASDSNAIKRAALSEKTTTDQAKLAQGAEKIALTKRTQAAKNNGLKGIDAAVKALSGTTSGSSTKSVAKGWKVTYQPLDPDTGSPSGNVTTIHMPSKKAPANGKFISAETNYATVPNTPSTTGVTQKQWDTQMRALIAQNPGKAKQVKAFLGPRPKK
jgi:hypothetical protein